MAIPTIPSVAASPREATIRTAFPADLRLILGPLWRGDATMRRDPSGAWWRATWTPDGPATARFQPMPGDGGVRVHAWGPGAEWTLDAAPGLIGVEDSLDGFSPGGGLVRDLHRRFPGLRLGRSRAVFEALVPQVIEQKVTGLEARRAYRGLVQRYGEPAPGQAGLRLPPNRLCLAALASHDWHPLGVEMRRAGVIRMAAQRADRLDGWANLPGAEAQRRLRLLPGVGAWTAAELSMVALGDPDAVSVGDYHLPHDVAWALAGEVRGSDERMLELLEPYAGHRARVIRLLGAAGIHAPRFGPRMTARSIRAQ